MWKRAKRRFSIYAPKVSIRPHIPWYLRWGLVLPFVLVAIFLIWYAYNSGLRLAGFSRSESQSEISLLHDKLAKLEKENLQLNNQVVQFERQMQMAQGNHQETDRQLKNLTDENAKLQADLSFFQSLTAAKAKEGELVVHRLRVERDNLPGEYHVRMLLVQGGQRVKDFVGHYQVVATLTKSGQKITQLFPQDSTANPSFELKFKYYQRIEQSIQLPPDAHVDSVQVRVFEQNEREPKIRQNVSIS